MKIGIIGGSGLDDPNILEVTDEKIILITQISILNLLISGFSGS